MYIHLQNVSQPQLHSFKNCSRLTLKIVHFLNVKYTFAYTPDFELEKKHIHCLLE